MNDKGSEKLIIFADITFLKRMLALYDQLPRYLLGKYQLLSTVTFTALFSIVFIIVSIPFSHNAWFDLGAEQSFIFTVSFIIIAALLVIVSKRLMYSMRNAKDFTLLKYIVWDIAEILAVSMLYTFFTYEGVSRGIIDLKQESYDIVFLSALVYAAVSLGVPYTLCGLYFAIADRDNTIRLMNYGNVAGDMNLMPHEEKRITLFDNNGVLKFSISSENLYFIESDDNYIKVWYADSSGALKQYMLRCRLKTIEDSFADSDLVRCHRKYVVNINKIKILKSEKDGYRIDLGIDIAETIPISKTYEQAVLARFNSR